MVAETPAIEPSAMEWSPPRTSGKSPDAVIVSTSRARLVHAETIGFMYFAFGYHNGLRIYGM